LDIKFNKDMPDETRRESINKFGDVIAHIGGKGGIPQKIIAWLEKDVKKFPVIITNTQDTRFDSETGKLYFNINDMNENSPQEKAIEEQAINNGLVAKDEQAPAGIRLIHEFGHMYRWAQGRLIPRDKKSSNGIPLEEIEDIKEIENPTRFIFKDELEKEGYSIIRTHYNNKPINEEEK
jgi:hypothetical protein